jgi:hypothetical protein
MKFDVVVGNPPYQDNSGQNTLYPKFYVKATELVNDDGYIAMITPPAIIPGLWGLKNPDGITMPKPLNIKSINIGDGVKKHFSSRISSNFCYFILQNNKSDNSAVTINTDNGTVIATSPIFPVAGNDLQMVQSILNKCFSFGKDYYGASSSDYGKKAVSDVNGLHEAVESISTDGTLKTRNITWLKEHPHFGSPKVLMPMYGKTAVIDYSHKLVSAAQENKQGKKLSGHNVITILTKSDSESESLISVLESRLQRFFNKVTDESRAPYVNFIKNFIGIPLDMVYDNDTLETKLGLSVEQKVWLNANF